MEVLLSETLLERRFKKADRSRKCFAAQDRHSSSSMFYQTDHDTNTTRQVRSKSDENVLGVGIFSSAVGLPGIDDGGLDDSIQIRELGFEIPVSECLHLNLIRLFPVFIIDLVDDIHSFHDLTERGEARPIENR